jgi:hypothetical protein
MAETVAGWPRGAAAEYGAAARLDTRFPASSAHPKCRETATCVPDPGHCQRPADRRGSSNVPRCGVSERGVRSSPADRIRGRKKSFSRVTTRRRKFRVLKSLRRGLRSLAARFLRLGVPGFDVGVLAMFGLPPRRLPAADLPLALGLLTIALVATPGLVLASTPFAEANPRARPAPSSPSVRLGCSLVSAHGRCFLPREGSGRMSNHSPRALSKREPNAWALVYRNLAKKTKNETA